MSYNTYSSWPEVIKDIYFNHRGRLSRHVFLLCITSIMLLTLISYFIVLPICVLLPHPLKGLAMLGYIFLIWYSCLVLTIKRFHDLNHVGWYSLFLCVPGLNILLCLYLTFKGGTPSRNNFGDPCPYVPPKVLVQVNYVVFIAILVLQVWFIIIGVSHDLASSAP